MSRQSDLSSLYDDLTSSPPDLVFGLAMRYHADPFPKKVNLTIGSYRTDACENHVFNVVKKAEKKLAEQCLHKGYLPIDGLASLKKPTQKIVFGAEDKAVEEGLIASVQSLSGSGALRLAGDFIRKITPQFKEIYISNPTWVNHINIFTAAGFECKNYTYWNKCTRDLDFEKMYKDLERIPRPSVILFHASGHNPTGVDPKPEQWEKICSLIKEKKHLPIFDLAYQGFISGNLDADATAIRICQKHKIEQIVCQSFAKNMGLYSERVGMLHVTCNSKASVNPVISHLKKIIRSHFSSPPNWGSRILDLVFHDPQLTSEWKTELTQIADRLKSLRSLLHSGLIAKKVPGSWVHILQQKGMFAYLGLSSEICNYIIDHWHVYLLLDGRINVAGITEDNVSRIVEAIDDAVRQDPSEMQRVYKVA